MAAIIQPHRLPVTRAARPELRLVHGGQAGRAASARPRHLLPGLAVVAIVLLAMAGAVAIGRGALAGLAPAPRASATASAAPTGRTVLVRPGDTMWSIARRLQPTGDVRALVDRLVAGHGSTALQPGDHLAVPR